MDKVEVKAWERTSRSLLHAQRNATMMVVFQNVVLLKGVIFVVAKITERHDRSDNRDARDSALEYGRAPPVVVLKGVIFIERLDLKTAFPLAVLTYKGEPEAQWEGKET
uniref:Pyridoxamine 5'-phosphate oxidase family protein n=1 Tax=Steinernema glaseri TaxID=37863 RepID=A0A1I7YB80_9BILA